MLLSLILVALPVQADEAMVADMCAPSFNLGLPYGIQDVDVPLDGIIPVLAVSECGGAGGMEVRLHRQVDGVTADEVGAVEVEVEGGDQELVLLAPEEPLLENTDYVVVLASDLGNAERWFSTGSGDAVGMAAGAPDLEIFQMTASEQDDGRYWLSVEFSIQPLSDPDVLSYLEVFHSDDPSTPVQVYLPGTLEDVSGYLGVQVASADEACFFVVQTDGLGNVSDTSAEACALPSIEETKMDRRGCSTAGSAPTLVSMFLAMLFGLRRRRA